MSTKILLVDDDETLCHLIKKGLEIEGYIIELAFDGVSGLEKISKSEFDLIIIDVMMPHLNGFETLNYIRKFSDVPVLMLTAKGEETDELKGLGIGADDYLHKPCSLAILKARVKTVLRRFLDKKESSKVIHLGDIEINFESKKVLKKGEIVTLTNSQFKLLCYLAENKNKTCTKEALCKKALRKPFLKNQRSIDTHINNLREKLLGGEDDAFSIVSIYGMGYELQCK